MHWRDIPGNEIVFDRLRFLLASGRAIGFLGSGASAGLYPTWPDLVGQLVDDAVAAGTVDDETASSWHRLRAASPELALQKIRRALGEDAFAGELARLFRPRLGPDRNGYTPIHAAAMRLPFKAFMTSSVDAGLLEVRRALRPDCKTPGVATWMDTPAVRSWNTGQVFAMHPCPLLFMQGVYDRSYTVLLGKKDCRRAFDEGPFRAMFLNAWGRGDLVLLGVRADEPWITALAFDLGRSGLGELADRPVALYGAPPGETDFALQRRVFLEDSNLDALFYETAKPVNGAEDCSGLLDIIAALQESLTDSSAPDAAVAPHADARFLPVENALRAAAEPRAAPPFPSTGTPSPEQR